MAAPGGAESTALTTPDRYKVVERLLRTEPWTFGFFQAVRLMERILSDRSPVGRFAHPNREVVRFGAHSVTAFPASQIQEIRWDTGAAPVVVINFMGLTGPSGVLPLYYSELVRERLRAKDTTMLAFFDLFNHRMISLFYQAWEKYRFTVSYERGERDRFSHHLLDLIGLGTPGLQNRQPVADDSLLFYSGLFAMHARSGSALRNILEDYFGVPAEVEQFTGAWRALSSRDQCEFQWGSSVSEQLGIGAVVGDEIWDQQSSALIRLGPLTLAQYMDFLPEGSAWSPLQAITRFFSGDEVDFEVQLVLKCNDVPQCRLDIDAAEEAPRLGWSTWVKTAPMRRDPDDTVLRI
jgi:type VI secretion system protein ImpH